MRKLFASLSIVFALAFTLGAFAPPAEAIGGGGQLPSNCHYECSCTGAPLRCCTTSTGGESCKPTDDIACPQIITC